MNFKKLISTALIATLFSYFMLSSIAYAQEPLSVDIQEKDSNMPIENIEKSSKIQEDWVNKRKMIQDLQRSVNGTQESRPEEIEPSSGDTSISLEDAAVQDGQDAVSTESGDTAEVTETGTRKPAVIIISYTESLINYTGRISVTQEGAVYIGNYLVKDNPIYYILSEFENEEVTIDAVLSMDNERAITKIHSLEVNNHTFTGTIYKGGYQNKQFSLNTENRGYSLINDSAIFNGLIGKEVTLKAETMRFSRVMEMDGRAVGAWILYNKLTDISYTEQDTNVEGVVTIKGDDIYIGAYLVKDFGMDEAAKEVLIKYQGQFILIHGDTRTIYQTPDLNQTPSQIIEKLTYIGIRSAQGQITKDQTGNIYINGLLVKDKSMYYILAEFEGSDVLISADFSVIEGQAVIDRIASIEVHNHAFTGKLVTANPNKIHLQANTPSNLYDGPRLYTLPYGYETIINGQYVYIGYDNTIFSKLIGKEVTIQAEKMAFIPTGLYNGKKDGVWQIYGVLTDITYTEKNISIQGPVSITPGGDIYIGRYLVKNQAIKDILKDYKDREVSIYADVKVTYQTPDPKQEPVYTVERVNKLSAIFIRNYRHNHVYEYQRRSGWGFFDSILPVLWHIKLDKRFQKFPIR